MVKKMKIVILGGTGFIGRSFSNYLSNSTDNKVYAPTRSQLDLLDQQSCKEYFKKSEPDLVIHCAVTVDSIEATLRSYFNVIACSAYVGRILYFGSGAEYNPLKYNPKMSESYSKASYPATGYPFAKWIVGKDIENSNLGNIFNLRLFGVFGNHEDFSRRFISNNICRVLSGLPLSMNKNMLFDYLYVEDLCQYVEKNFFSGTVKYNTYNVCTGNPISLYALANIIKDVMKVKSEIIINEIGENSEYSGDPTRVFEEFGEIKITKFDTAVANMVNYFEKKFENKPDLKKLFWES